MESRIIHDIYRELKEVKNAAGPANRPSHVMFSSETKVNSIRLCFPQVNKCDVSASILTMESTGAQYPWQALWRTSDARGLRTRLCPCGRVCFRSFILEVSSLIPRVTVQKKKVLAVAPSFSVSGGHPVPQARRDRVHPELRGTNRPCLGPSAPLFPSRRDRRCAFSAQRGRTRDHHCFLLHLSRHARGPAVASSPPRDLRRVHSVNTKNFYFWLNSTPLGSSRLCGARKRARPLRGPSRRIPFRGSYQRTEN